MAQRTLGIVSLLAVAAVGLLAPRAVAEPTVAPLTNEPIVRALDSHSSDSVQPGQLAAPLASSLGAVVSAPSQSYVGQSSTASIPLTRRNLILYAIVVVSLLGAMVITIWLILRLRPTPRSPGLSTALSQAGSAVFFSQSRKLSSASASSEPRWAEQSPVQRSTFSS